MRNVQQIQISKNPAGVAFADIGGVTAEEVDFLQWSDIFDISEIENFGWGHNPDGLAREGTFYVSPGQAFQLAFEPAAIGFAPEPELGFKTVRVFLLSRFRDKYRFYRVQRILK